MWLIVKADDFSDSDVLTTTSARSARRDGDVQAALSNTVWLQADVTVNDAADQALLNRFGVFGPPTIIFFGTDGEQRLGYEVVGYMKAQDFAKHVRQALLESDSMSAQISN